MKPEPFGHSYVITATEAEFRALPQTVPEHIGGCAKGRIGDQLVVRRREALHGGMSCITNYPLNLKEDA